MRARTLVFAPHADDEVLGCGGAIVLKVRSGAPVQVVIMTDGRASHRISPEELIRIREEEALEAGKRLGLPAENYHFLRFEDHALHDHVRAAAAEVKQLLERFQPEEVFVPHARDALSDHVATNMSVRLALRDWARPVTVLEYPVWLWNTWPWTGGRSRASGGGLRQAAAWAKDVASLIFGCRAHVEIDDVRTVKMHALRAYSSQVERQGGDPTWPILSDVSNGEFLARFLTDRETFYKWQHRP